MQGATRPAPYRLAKLSLLDVELLEQTVRGVLGHDEVLVLLVDLHLDFLDSSVLLPERILGLLVAAGFLVKSGLQVSDAGLQLGNHALATEQSSGLGLLDLHLQLLHLKVCR